jgi:hypothetical protein
MSKDVTIIGCGQLGSRHLQAIAKLHEPLKIQVVEPNKENQERGIKRVSEVLPENHSVEIEWFDNMENLHHTSDLTIIATNSIGRTENLIDLASKGHKRFLVEKIVCQSKAEYESILKIFDKHQVKAWVDCTRRYFPFYERFISLMENEKMLIFNVTGGNHGLGCNAIHFFDLFWRMIGLSKMLKLNGDYLTPMLLPNPRGTEFVEFSGTIVASTPEKCFASVSFHPGNNAPILINMISDNYRIAVNESKDKALVTTKENDWQWEEEEFQVLYSSNLTTKIASSIFEHDTCNLPTIQDSFLLHNELFEIFNQHIKYLTGKNVFRCPIT